MSQPTSDQTSSDTKSCHWMPCSVSQDGIAAVNLYFQPKSKNVHGPCASSDKSLKGRYCIQNVTFRGRGLLSFKPAELPSDVGGHIIHLDGRKNQAYIKGSFRYLHEWEHEWDEKEFSHRLPDPEQHRGVEYLEIMKALHEPIFPDS